MGLLISKSDAPALPLPLQRTMYKLSPWESLFSPRLLITTTLSIHLSSFIYLSICLSIYLSIFIYMQVHGHDVRSERPIYLNSIVFSPIYYYTVKNGHTTSSLTSPKPRHQPAAVFFVSPFFVAIGMSSRRHRRHVGGATLTNHRRKHLRRMITCAAC